jgi:hypothetical protein
MFVVRPVYFESKVGIFFVVRLLKNTGFAVSHVAVNTFCVGTFSEIENWEADHVYSVLCVGILYMLSTHKYSKRTQVQLINKSFCVGC